MSLATKTNSTHILQTFYKYQGTGNDFIMIDNRDKSFQVDHDIIAQMCDRRFGIGADGLILLQHKDEVFQMIYYNSDGNQSTMCGNGGRCFIRFLADLKLIENEVHFQAIDGMHHGEIMDAFVKLQMMDVEEIDVHEDYTFLNTGSPHHVIFRDGLVDFDVKKEGAEIRYSERYPEGVNVNFVHQLSPNRIEIRTYERGVEDETLSCGTGVTAAAITLAALNKTQMTEINVKTSGGNLQVHFTKTGNTYTDIQLIGPAEFVFTGKIKI